MTATQHTANLSNKSQVLDYGNVLGFIDWSRVARDLEESMIVNQRVRPRRALPSRWDTLTGSWLSLSVFVALSATVIVYGYSTHRWNFPIATGLLLILTTKLVLALIYQRSWNSVIRGTRVAVVIACYNEDPDTLEAGLRSLLVQTYPLSEIVLVDDGSASTAAIDRARALIPSFGTAGINLTVLEHGTNLGKRHAMATAFRHAADADIYACVDSDTVLEPDSITEALRPFTDPGVQVVTGLVLAVNRSRNLLTRLINLRYGNAFSYERASYSVLNGSMLCACGSLALYRGSLVRKYLRDFVGQRFLGQPATFGDDRRMTYYGLLEGKAVYQESARARTAVPENLKHFMRQQMRWNKSFFRESLTVLRTMSASRVAWWLTAIELGMWLSLTGFMLASAVQLVTGDLTVFTSLAYVILFGYARSVRYLDLPEGVGSLSHRLAAFAIAPVYGGLHIMLLVPIRWWSLLTIRDGRWGTRSKIEVPYFS